MSIRSKEYKDKKIALLTTVLIHTLVLVLFSFVIAWRSPNPPLPEYGIELSFATDYSEETHTEYVTQQPSSEEEETALPIHQEESQQEKESVHDIFTVPDDDALNLPDSKKDDFKMEKKDEQPNSDLVEQNLKPLKPKKEPVIDPKTQYVKQGDDEQLSQSKGDPQGKVDKKALFGGNASGMTLSMSGWEWADEPAILKLDDREGSGRIVFEIECDQHGEIVRIRTLERGISSHAEQILKEEIQKSSLIRTSGSKVPERSTGRIIFVLKSK